MEKAYFNIESSEYYEGYHIDSERCNGWARPYFEKVIADLIAHNFSASDYEIVYDKYTDCYICKIIENGRVVETETAEKIVIDTKDGKKEVYDFGCVGWTWDSYTLDEIKKKKDIHIISKDKFKEKDDTLNLEY